jgi:hypothetical protein
MGKLQTILIPKKLFNLEQSISWIMKHNYYSRKVAITKNYYRFRQRAPCHYCVYYSFRLPNGIIFVLAE